MPPTARRLDHDHRPRYAPRAAPDEAERAVLLAAPRGYCAGVDRAVVTVEKALDLYGSPVYVRKQIVHNKHVVADLESRGAIFVEELEEVPAGATVVFSAHGVSPEVHRQAEERELKTIDATCPLVTKVHHEARRFAGDDYDILLIGHAGHEEVEGTAARRPSTSSSSRARPTSPASWSATRPGSPGSPRPPCRSTRPWRPWPRSASGSRCCSTRRATTSATRPRTASSRSRRSPATADLLIVVGSGNSSNSVRLVEVALEAGAKASYRVDDASEIDEAWLDGVRTVSVTSGASVPESLVEEVLAYLGERGYPDAQAVHSAEESLIFSLPKELRRDLKAAGRS